MFELGVHTFASTMDEKRMLNLDNTSDILTNFIMSIIHLTSLNQLLVKGSKEPDLMMHGDKLKKKKDVDFSFVVRF